MAKIGRNQPCPCGSGKKYKKCHGALNKQTRPLNPVNFLAQLRAREHVRQSQQGLGKPVISAQSHGYQIVAVGNKLFWSQKWKTFPDFLGDYIKKTLGSDWGNAEIAKPLEQRHPLMQWYDAYARYQQAEIKQPGQIQSSQIIGVVACYLGLAYALYLLDHNAELQARLVHRLKDIGNFQGAYYESLIAGILIRAGFTLEIEDESDPETKHCEFSAVSKTTSKKYWVEAKMRSVAGLLGKSAKDGGADNRPFSRLGQHLNGAFGKPASDDRLIFIDLNAPPRFDAAGIPEWVAGAVTRLEQYETKELSAASSAYVFITNFSAHRQLDAMPSIAAISYGLGISDFSKHKELPIINAYRQKQKHKDAFAIGAAIERYLRFPSTFDGRLPSEAKTDNSTRVQIGQTYFFSEIGDKGVVATVTDAIVDEAKKETVLAVVDQGGRSFLYKKPMSDDEVSEYLDFKDSYFGVVKPSPSSPKDEFEMFEWLMEANKTVSREKILAWFSSTRDKKKLMSMSDEDLLLTYCDALLASLLQMQKKNDNSKAAIRQSDP